MNSTAKVMRFRVKASLIGASLIVLPNFITNSPSVDHYWNNFWSKTIAAFYGYQTSTSTVAVKPEFKFREAGEEAGLSAVHVPNEVAKEISHLSPLLSSRGASVSVADFNNDGRMDFYYTSAGEGSLNSLYRNNGDGTFTNVATEMGVADINHGINSMSALWFDYDRDGWKDLYVVAMGCNLLFRNLQGQRFVDVTDQAGDIRGIPNEHGFCGSPRSALALDYNLDGHLDVFVSNFNPKDWRKIHNNDTGVMYVSAVYDPNGPKSYLFKNNGDGTFSDVSDEMGVANYHWAQSAGSSDFNNDGWPDLFVANDVGHDRVFINREGKYFDLQRNALPHLFPRYGMNGDIADFNDDGLPDIFNTKITKPGYTAGRNQLWLNQGNGSFLDTAMWMGVSGCGWEYPVADGPGPVDSLIWPTEGLKISW